MADGLETTLALLADTENEAAAKVLLCALAGPEREISDLALAALLCRRCEEAEWHILERWHELSQRWKTQVAQRPGWLSGAIRKAVGGDDRRLFRCACAAAVSTHDYDLISIFVDAAADVAHPCAAQSAATALELAELLADELMSPRDYRVRRDPHRQRDHALPRLERAVLDLEKHGQTPLLEAFVLLASRENAALKHLLQPKTNYLAAALSALLESSSRPAVTRLLLSYLDDSHPPLTALAILGRRSDLSFLRHLCRKLGGELGASTRANLRRIENIPALSGNLSALAALSEIEQVGAVQLAALSAVKRRKAFGVVEYVLMHGKVEARRAAAAALMHFKGEEVNDAAVRAMEDADPEVRAAIASQLREKGVLGAIPRLVALLDSPHEAERAAAQASLSEFCFEQFATTFEEMPADAQRNTGLLVRRVDPLAIHSLRQELDSPVRGRRIRALKMALALRAVKEAEEAIADLLLDDDQFLRVEAIRTLATADSPFIRQTLRDALLDANPLVNEAAETALVRLAQLGAAKGSPGRVQPITGIGTGLAAGDSAKPLTYDIPETVL